MHHQLEPRQSSDGCGPNPLVAIIAYAREFGTFTTLIRSIPVIVSLPDGVQLGHPCFPLKLAADFSPQQLMRFIETDTRAGSQLRTLLRAYDDCVRTGDGTRYKKRGASAQYREETYEDLISTNNIQPSMEQVNQSLLRALGDQRRPSSGKSLK